jgi:hypothetical protein
MLELSQGTLEQITEALVIQFESLKKSYKDCTRLVGATLYGGIWIDLSKSGIQLADRVFVHTYILDRKLVKPGISFTFRLDLPERFFPYDEMVRDHFRYLAKNAIQQLLNVVFLYYLRQGARP